MSIRIELQQTCIDFQNVSRTLAAEEMKEEVDRCTKTINKCTVLSTLYFNQIYETLNITLLSHISKILKAGNFSFDIEQELTREAHQDTFLNFYRKIDQFLPDRQMTTWIHKIATNEALKVLHRERECKKEVAFTDMMFSDSSENEEYNTRNMMSNDESSSVNFTKIYENTVVEVSDLEESLFSKKYALALECIEELPEKYKNIITDKYVNNIKQTDLELYYDLNLNTIKTRDRKAKKDLVSLYNKRIQTILDEHKLVY